MVGTGWVSRAPTSCFGAMVESGRRWTEIMQPFSSGCCAALLIPNRAKLGCVLLSFVLFLCCSLHLFQSWTSNKMYNNLWLWRSDVFLFYLFACFVLIFSKFNRKRSLVIFSSTPLQSFNWNCAHLNNVFHLNTTLTQKTNFSRPTGRRSKPVLFTGNTMVSVYKPKP